MIDDNELEDLQDAMESSNPLDMVNCFTMHPADVGALPDYWVNKLCVLAELRVKHVVQSLREVLEQAAREMCKPCRLDAMVANYHDGWKHYPCAGYTACGAGPIHEMLAELDKEGA